jgi:hypothetical protein
MNSQSNQAASKTARNKRKRERKKLKKLALASMASSQVSSKSKKGGVNANWNFGLDKFKLGPIDVGGIRFGSKSMRAASRGAGSMVGLGTKAINIQKSMPRLMTTRDENGNTVDRISGTDLLATLTVGQIGANVGDILLTQLVSPNNFQFTRLIQFSALYQRYRFRRITFFYEPIANATQSGQLIFFSDFDVDNIISTNSPDNVSIASAHQGHQITQIWEPATSDFGQLQSFTDLYTQVGSQATDDPRLSIQGVFYVIAASALTADIPLGNIYVDYEVDFSVPFLNIYAAGSASTGVFEGKVALSDVQPPALLQWSLLEEYHSFGGLQVSNPDTSTLLIERIPSSSLLHIHISGSGGNGGTFKHSYSLTVSPSVPVSNEDYIAVGESTDNSSAISLSCDLTIPQGVTQVSLQWLSDANYAGPGFGAYVTIVAMPNAPAFSKRRARQGLTGFARELESLRGELRELRMIAKGIAGPGGPAASTLLQIEPKGSQEEASSNRRTGETPYAGLPAPLARVRTYEAGSPYEVRESMPRR